MNWWGNHLHFLNTTTKVVQLLSPARSYSALRTILQQRKDLDGLGLLNALMLMVRLIRRGDVGLGIVVELAGEDGGNLVVVKGISGLAVDSVVTEEQVLVAHAQGNAAHVLDEAHDDRGHDN